MLKAFDDLALGEYQLVNLQRPMPLHTMVASVGHCEERSPAYDWYGLGRGRSRFILFQWTISGRGTLDYGGRSYAVTPGQAMLLQIPHAHRYYLPPDSSHWRFLYLCMHGTETLRVFRHLQRAFGPVWELAQESAPVQTALRIYREAASGKLNNPFVISAAAYEMAMTMGAERYFQKSRVTDRFAPVRAHVEKNFSEKLDVQVLARIAGMSRYHFTRQFARAEGSTPWEYLVQVRVRKAALLLGDSKLSIKEISARAGFSNANYMSKVFRRVMGISPGEFRQSGMYSSRLR